jgi:hypothetical protein
MEVRIENIVCSTEELQAYHQQVCMGIRISWPVFHKACLYNPLNEGIIPANWLYCISLWKLLLLTMIFTCHSSGQKLVESTLFTCHFNVMTLNLCDDTEPTWQIDWICKAMLSNTIQSNARKPDTMMKKKKLWNPEQVHHAPHQAVWCTGSPRDSCRGQI